MRRNLIAIAATTAAAFVGIALTAQPAAAATNVSKVTVTVKATNSPAKTATLACSPVGGTHRNAADACALLATAAGNPAAITPADLMCTMEYAPVKVKVYGRWNGRNVKFKETFSNPCRTTVEGGALFNV